MSQEIRQTELRAKTQQLLQGPLKHIRGAALAAALLPLASVVATPASAQSVCPQSGGVCGTIFNDVNNNGFQDAGEGVEDVTVTVCELCDGTDNISTQTGPSGYYVFELPTLQPSDVPNTYTVSVVVPTGMQALPPNVGDSDGVPMGAFSVAQTPGSPGGPGTDFGFSTARVVGPGTGTPGYWKNHPEAWPVQTITVGAVPGMPGSGITYSKADAIMWLGKVGKDKTTTMFSSLVPAMLNLIIGNQDCVSATIADGNAWMATYGPVGSKVPASSVAWSTGEPTHIMMDAYNNGLLCAAHRN